MATKEPVVTLSILLFREGIKQSDAIDPQLSGDLKSHAVMLGGAEIGTLYVKQTPTHPPDWAKFFRDGIAFNRRDLNSASVAAIYLTRAANRFFALSFGSGRFLLNPGSYEERFGLRATLNSIDPSLLRAVDITTLDANPFHGKRQAARAAPLGEFGLNLDQDVLRAVTGKPLDESLGTQMAGTDSLSVRVRTSLGALKRLLARYLAKSEEKTYRQSGFAWVDHVAQVRDQRRQEQLFAIVVKALKGGNGAHVWAAIPEVIDWTSFDCFRFGTPTGGDQYDDIRIDKLLKAIGGESPTLELLKKKRVHAMAIDLQHPQKSWPFLQCLVAEVRDQDVVYLLNAGAWYRVDADYARQVDADIAQIPSTEQPLPAWGDENEATYNQRIASQSGGHMALMDKVMVSHPGMASPIEFCDLYSHNRRMIHVKRYGQSTVLSHLFAQGLVSASSILSDEAFRRAVNAKLPAANRQSHQFVDPTLRISPETYEVAFCIGSTELGTLKLPFFSRVTLRNAYKTLRYSYGYRVTLSKIQVNKLAQVAN